jgi:hypothetical protein
VDNSNGREIILDMKRRRNLRIPMYAGLVASGIFAVVDPSELVSMQVSRLVAVVWSLAMIVSAGMCLYGSVTDKWIGEYSGLPLLASVLALYGGSAMLSVEEGGFIILAYGLAMISFAFGLCARWKDVRLIKHHSEAGGPERNGGEAGGNR